MKSGLGLSLSKGGNGGSGSPPAAPTATFANKTPYAFDLTWTAGSNNTGTYFVNASTDSLFATKLGIYDNLLVNGLLENISGLSGLHQYYAQVRAALNKVVPPTLRTSWYATVNATWIDGNSGEIQNAINSITDASSVKWYKVALTPGKVYNEHLIQMIPYADLYVPSTTTVSYTGSTDVNQDLIYSGGNNMIFGGGTLTRTTDGSGTPDKHCYPIRYWHNVVGDFIVDNMTLNGLGTNSASAIEIETTNPGGRVFVTNSTLYSQVHDGVNVHGFAGGAGQTFFINCSIHSGSPFPTIFFSIAYGAGASPYDYVYVQGCTMDSFANNNSGGGVFVYIDPTTTWDHSTTYFNDPTKLLTTAQFTTFITGGGAYYLSDWSNIVSVITASEGNNDLDNITIGTIFGAWDTKYQLRSAVAATLTLDKAGTPQTFAYPVDQVAVDTFRGVGTVRGKVLPDLSGNGYDFSNVTTGSTQSEYKKDDIISGIPSLVSIAGTVLKTAAYHDVGINVDVVCVVNIQTVLMLLAGSPSGKANAAFYQANGGTLFGVELNNNLFNIANHAIARNANVVLRLKMRGAFSGATMTLNINGVLITPVTSAFTTQELIFDNLFNDESGTQGILKFARVVCFTNAVDSEIAAFEQKCISTYSIV